MKITLAHIEQGRSVRGGLNREQVELLGASWPLKDGWMRKVIGTDISIRDYDRFLSLQGQLVRQPKKQRRSVVKTDLPVPAGYPVKAETVFASFYLYVSKMDANLLKISLPLAEFIVRKMRQRVERH